MGCNIHRVKIPEQRKCLVLHLCTFRDVPQFTTDILSEISLEAFLLNDNIPTEIHILHHGTGAEIGLLTSMKPTEYIMLHVST